MINNMTTIELKIKNWIFIIDTQTLPHVIFFIFNYFNKKDKHNAVILPKRKE